MSTPRVYALMVSSRIVGRLEYVDTIVGIYANYDDACWDCDEMTKRALRSESKIIQPIYYVRGHEVREGRDL